MIMAKTALYQERFDRIKKAINLEPVDRVPVVFQAQAFSARYMGIPMDKYCSSSSIPFWANLDAMDKIGGLDGARWPDTPFSLHGMDVKGGSSRKRIAI
jgi:uroporphyrinogen-III decarboxylase